MKRLRRALLRASVLSVFLCGGAFVSACAAGSTQIVPMPSQELEVENPKLCRVYVFREGQPLGRSRTMRVHDQQLEIGTVSGGEYLCWERSPGRALLRLVYEGPQLDRGDLEAPFDLHAKAGAVYYFAASLRSGSELSVQGKKRGSPILRPLSEQEGLELLDSYDAVRVR